MIITQDNHKQRSHVIFQHKIFQNVNISRWLHRCNIEHPAELAKLKNIGLTIPGNWSFEIYKFCRFCRWIPREICRISWNLADFTWNLHKIRMKSSRFHLKSAGFHLKSSRFHLKSAGFPEIHRISWMWAFGWSPSIGLSFERPIRKTSVVPKHFDPST